MQVLKEICDKDPINATYITIYTSLLVQAEFADGGAADSAN